MNKVHSLPIITVLMFLTGCCAQIELVGYGTPKPIQHGLEVKLTTDSDKNALLMVKNCFSETISLNNSPDAMEISIENNGKKLEPSERIIYDKISMSPNPDKFEILLPNQTRIIPLPFTFEKKRCRTRDGFYSLDRGVLYTVSVQINPYFERFTAETADSITTAFKIPNYLNQIIFKKQYMQTP